MIRVVGHEFERLDDLHFALVHPDSIRHVVEPLQKRLVLLVNPLYAHRQ